MGGGFADYMYCDARGHRLYVGYTSDGSIVAIDTRTNRVLYTVHGLPGAHGLAIANGLGFASSGRDNSVGVIDLRRGKLIEKIKVGEGPDGIIYDPGARLVYVGDHAGKAATLINPVTRTALVTIPIGGVAEYARADPHTGLVYQNLEDTSQLAVVDPRTKSVVHRWSLTPGEGPSGLALDAAHHRAFAACGNKTLVIVNTDTGGVVSTVPIGAGVDFASYDPALHRIYTANGESGTMTVVEEVSPDQYRVLRDVPTHEGGHALAVDDATHRIYVVYGNHVAVYRAVR
jgi:DNA-binding beta-propeller fold protein YncE